MTIDIWIKKAYVCIYSNNISGQDRQTGSRSGAPRRSGRRTVNGQTYGRTKQFVKVSLSTKKEEKPGKTSRDKKSCSDWQYNL